VIFSPRARISRSFGNVTAGRLVTVAGVAWTLMDGFLRLKALPVRPVPALTQRNMWRHCANVGARALARRPELGAAV
jgi:hypothetical protein